MIMSKLPKELKSKSFSEVFISQHGWINYGTFNSWALSQGFNVTQLERHNRTDGEVHFMYECKISGEKLEFNGNYWNGQSFQKVYDWIINLRDSR